MNSSNDQPAHHPPSRAGSPLPIRTPRAGDRSEGSIARRQFLGFLLGPAVLGTSRRLAGADQPDPAYVRANTDWLARCRFGIGIHWTAQTVPRHGPPKPFAQAVAAFDVGGFVAAVEHAGADYVLFTAAHALQKLPAPHPVLDRILPGRTCERDLIRDLAEALASKRKHLLVYYNHSCNHQQDPAWEQAVGYHAPDKQRFTDNLTEIVAWMGDRYGEQIKASKGSVLDFVTRLDAIQATGGWSARSHHRSCTPTAPPERAMTGP